MSHCTKCGHLSVEHSGIPMQKRQCLIAECQCEQYEDPGTASHAEPASTAATAPTVAAYIAALGTVEVRSANGSRYQIRGTENGLRMRWWREDINRWASVWYDASTEPDLLILPIIARSDGEST